MCLVWAGMTMALYGIAQFVLLPEWDAQWMRNVIELGLDSIGQPEPFAVRVFSTMNSPGSFGIMLMAAIIVALKTQRSDRGVLRAADAGGGGPLPVPIALGPPRLRRCSWSLSQGVRPCRAPILPHSS